MTVMAKAVLFDMDGTLLDTLQDIALSGNRMLSSMDLPTHPLDAYRYFVGAGALNLVTMALPEEKKDEKTIQEGLKRLLAFYDQTWMENTRPYPGIPDMLNFLQEKGYRLAILSNKPDSFTKKCAARYLSAWNFEEVWGKRDGFKPKPSPESALKIAGLMNLDPSAYFYLGDTRIDMETAVSTGMYPAGVTWGFRPSGELLAAGAKVLLQHPMDITNFL